MARTELDKLLKAKGNAALVKELARQELARRQAENPLKYFIPNGAQERLIDAVADPEKDLYVLPAANSVGKSAIAISILGNFIWGPQSPWFDKGRFAAQWEFPKKFWYISEQSTLKDFVCGVDESITNSEIRKWFTPGRYDFTKSGLEFYSRITTDTGWTGTFKTYDQDPSKFESDKIGIAIFDEPPPKAIYNAVMARLTLGGIVIMPMTPLFSSAWVQDEIVDKAAFDPSIYVFIADIEENCKQHGRRGRLEHSQIEKILSRYDKDELDARAKGLFMHLSGLVYRELHPSIHRKRIENHTDPRQFSQDKYKIYCVCDPHDARPPMVGWFAVDEWQNAWLVDEFPSVPEFAPFHEMKSWKYTTQETVKMMMEKEQRNGWKRPRDIIRIMDPNFGLKPVQAVGRTIRETYAHAGTALGYPMSFTTSVSDDLAAGHQIVKDLYTPNADGDTRLHILERCSNIWYALTHYSWKPVSAKKAETDGLSEFVAQRYKDGADVVRYFSVYMRKLPPKIEKKEINTLDDFVYEVLLPRIKKRAASPQRSWAQL